MTETASDPPDVGSQREGEAMADQDVLTRTFVRFFESEKAGGAE